MNQITKETRLESYLSTNPKIKIGDKYGKLTVIKLLGNDKHGKRHWECRCECGGFATPTTAALLNGNTKSCGCYQKERASTVSKKHGKRHTSLYGVWADMKGRCERQTSHKYHCYGARGIKVCEEWKNDFATFYKWAMENGYDENAPYGECTLDRIDVNGDYEPNNCRWANQKIQANNKRDTIQLTARGETLPISYWAEITGLKRSTIYERLYRGMSNEEALKPIGTYASRRGVKHKNHKKKVVGK